MLGDRRHVELAKSILLALPGAPVIRYGDEIGMGEDLSLKECPEIAWGDWTLLRSGPGIDD